ncbi:uncharacterized protein LOC103930291 [Pyrus x bretschneideri]|uniref:uncharacterized protein LOC103930291 n=1 Tax=Pyrus x bretschneideri TaxID=225117 RepID=UPI0020308E61|nr:uncharacterized protein LOC103930291 [Pyrus x bretschneideri]XP_009337880.2 uncharacterized protein LOC103930291 [Pyrus x bretschneideri]XP_018498780.2 uncharacterized protein LOC103930291 [Pyrus x bretschneideri]XP_048436984.1 uncharacterized protein LOC103930291 [Pyrus x bretschneideri]
MSLAFLQGYSSPEEEEQDHRLHDHGSSSTDDDDSDDGDDQAHKATSVFDFPKPSSSVASTLPSASDVFSEISGPPEFLNNCVQEDPSARDAGPQRGRHGVRNGKLQKEKKDLPSGAVVESKAHLVGIHERVRSDFEGKQPPTSVVTSTAEGAKRVPTATNPSAEDAAALLRMCLQCGIPKTYSNARGMVCPTCGDRPVDPTNDSKKKGSTVKDKEKSKRMKGQSSHATWKSETEMHLRQQFD